MIVTVGVGDMFIDIDELLDANGDADFLLHFSVQSAKDRLPVLDLAAGHDPEAMKGINAPAGEENAIVLIDDAGND